MRALKGLFSRALIAALRLSLVGLFNLLLLLQKPKANQKPKSTSTLATPQSKSMVFGEASVLAPAPKSGGAR